MERVRSRRAAVNGRSVRTALRAAAAVVVAFAALAADAGDGARVRVVDLRVERAADEVRVSYRLEGTTPDDAVERLGAGIAVTFRHRVELVQRRSFLGMGYRTVHRCDVETTATYDSLTKLYTLERSVRPRPSDDDPPEPSVETRTTGRVEDVRAWMSEIPKVALPTVGLRPGGRARIKVESDLGRRYVLLMFPSTISAEAEVDLEG